MKTFAAIALTGALLVAGVAVGVRGYSLETRVTAASDTSRAGLADAVQQSAEPCRNAGVCDDYAIWMALHAAP